MNVNIQPFSIKYNDNNGAQYVARSIPSMYTYANGQAIPQACDLVNVAQIDTQGRAIGYSNMTHEQFFSYLLQNGINVPYNQYEMPKIN